MFPSLEGTRIKEGNEQDFFSYHRIRDISFHYYWEYFSRICGHARITPPPPPQPVTSLTFLNSIDTRKIYFYCQTFFITFQPSTTARSIEQNSFIFLTRFFYLHVLAEFLYVLKISIISIIEVQTILPEELNMYLAEFIRSFRIKDR